MVTRSHWALLFLLMCGHGTGLLCVAAQPDKVRMCYVTNWSNGVSGFTPASLDPFACTHVLYAFGPVSNDGTSLQMANANDAVIYGQLRLLRERNPSLKILLSVGGADPQQTAALLVAARDGPAAMKFAGSAVAFLRQHGFDGLDLDWEFPNPTTRLRFQFLLASLGDAFTKEAANTSGTRLLLTAAVWGNHEEILNSYSPSDIAYFVDYFLLMTYNLWGTWVSKLGHHTALDARPQDKGDLELNRYSIKKTVDAWLQQGISASKLVLGLASYGRTSQLTTAQQHNVGDAYTRQLGSPGRLTQDKGSLAYYEICEKTKSWQVLYENYTEGAFAYSSSAPYDWVCYDDARSVRAKTEYALNRGLGGVFFWTVDLDDHSGQFCGSGSFPLLRAAVQVFQIYNQNSSVSSGPITSTVTSMTSRMPSTVTPGQTSDQTTASLFPSKTSSTTLSSGSARRCPGYRFRCPRVTSSDNPANQHPDPTDCRYFYQCLAPGTEGSVFFRMPCPAGLHYDAAKSICNWQAEANCFPCDPAPA